MMNLVSRNWFNPKLRDDFIDLLYNFIAETPHVNSSSNDRVGRRRMYCTHHPYIAYMLSGIIYPGQRERSPDYQKLYSRGIHIWDTRRGQPNRSAMERPHPGGTAFMITVNL